MPGTYPVYNFPCRISFEKQQNHFQFALYANFSPVALPGRVPGPAFSPRLVFVEQLDVAELVNLEKRTFGSERIRQTFMPSWPRVM